MPDNFTTAAGIPTAALTHKGCTMQSETPRWEMPDGSFVVMNLEFAEAYHNTKRDWYRNMYLSLIPDFYHARKESDYCDSCGQLRETQNCEYC